MIPATTTHSLLEILRKDLLTSSGEPNFARFESLDAIEGRYQFFWDVIANCEDDFSIILSLIERDPDCGDFNLEYRLQALVGYVEIAQGIYEPINVNI